MTKLKMGLKVLLFLYLIHLKFSFVVPQVQPRIAGGTKTNITEVQSLVQVLYRGLLKCGGSLVSPRLVVTAGHCVYGLRPENLTIVAGVTFIKETGITKKVKKIKLHKGYDHKLRKKDVAILILKSPIEDASVKTIDLCTKQWQVGADVKIYGWGSMSGFYDNYPKRLRTTTLKAVKTFDCVVKYRYLFFFQIGMVCATSPDRKGSCSGDEGGPAIIDGKLCGIISIDTGCGHPSYPAIFTDIISVRRFIRNHIKRIDGKKTKQINEQ